MRWGGLVSLVLMLQAGRTTSFLGTAVPLGRMVPAGQPVCTRYLSPVLLHMSADVQAADGEADARRAAYARGRDAREQQLLPTRVDMAAMFEGDTCPDYIERWGGMHRQVAMEGPTRQALQMVVQDSEWYLRMCAYGHVCLCVFVCMCV